MADRDRYRNPWRDIYTDYDEEPPRPAVSPGKIPATARLASHVTNVVFRAPDPGQAAGQRDSNGVAPDASSQVDRASGTSGQRLPDDLRRQFEGSLGTDLSSLRVHTGRESAEAARAVGAKAYAVGQDVHFGAGQYDPTSEEGQTLIAHEVAHTVQQHGAAAKRQHKLFVSTAVDAAEVEADRAADAMLAGLPAEIGSAGGSRKISRLQDTDAIEQAGDAAAAHAQGASLAVDSASVTVDSGRVNELIQDIEAQNGPLNDATQAGTLDTVRGDPQQALAVNAAAKAALEIFNDRLWESDVDTKAFAVQYRIANADYERLMAEATQYLGADMAFDPVGTAGSKIAGESGMKLDSGMAEFNAFRTARANLNTAATKMEGKLTKARGAASALQGALYAAKAAAARAKADAAKSKLNKIRAEIEETAANVGKVVKLASAVAGLAGGGGETAELGKETPDISNTTIQRSPDNIFANPTPGHYALKDQHVNPEGESSKLKLIAAMGKDTAELGGIEAEGLAEKLVTAVGEYAEKGKISKLQSEIASEMAVNDTFKAAGATQTMVGHVDTLNAAAQELTTNVAAFKGAKAEMTRSREALMAALSKKGAKGKKQAKAVLFLSDADRFLAQVRNAISVGHHQQKQLEQAADQRKSLRGSVGAYDGQSNATQVYYQCRKMKTKGRLWGTNNYFRLTKVDVSFSDGGGLGYNDRVQGGQGSVEGVGGASDVVAQNIKQLEERQKEVKAMQTKVQTSLGVGGPGLNA